MFPYKEWAGYGKYDVAVANILADVIILLVDEIPAHLKKGGIFITSGIIDMKEEAVKEAFAALLRSWKWWKSHTRENG